MLTTDYKLNNHNFFIYIFFCFRKNEQSASNAAVADNKSIDDIDLLSESFQLPELLTDFKAELTRLQDAMTKVN